MSSEVARLVGMEQREYMGQDGRQRQFCGLHLLYAEGTVRDVQGSKVDSVSCPRELDPRSLKIGTLYELVYELYNTKNGKGARLVDLLPVDEPPVK